MATLQEQIAAVAAAEAANSPTASAGQVASDDGSTGVQNPNLPNSVIDTSGRINASAVETGTNAPVTTLVQSQATPQSDVQVFNASQVNQDLTGQIATPATPTTSPGVGATSEDTATPTKNSTRQEIDNAFSTAVTPQPNVLDQYASYTYTASVYLMKPEAFNAMVKSKKKSLSGAQLLFQSAGAPVTGRNQFFSNDYYIDRFEIKSAITGKGTNSSHNANSIKMTVVEPNGITLIENLDKAVQQYLGNAGNPPKKKNFQSQLYLLVIRFYGYDDNGNLVQAGQPPGTGTNTAPQTAFVEKYYPFALNAIRFKIANKLVEYEFDATAVQYQVNTGQLRAVIPYNIELSSSTLQDAFNGAAEVGATTTTSTTGNTTTTTVETTRETTNTTDGSTPAPTAPQNAASAPTAKLTVRQGIVQAMNKIQQDKVKAGEITYPDVYSVEFVTNAIAQAKIKREGQTKKADPTPVGGTPSQVLLPEKQSVDSSTRLLSIAAGQPMIQVIDQLLKNSTYIEDQQLVKILEDSGVQVPNGAPGKNLAWYKVSMQATPSQYDPLRNGYAYNIKYIIHPYKINDMISNYFNGPTYNGVHKQYNYWFTGLNTQILNYEQTYNSLYQFVLSGGPPNKNVATQSTVQAVPATRSSQSSQGAQGRTNEPAANAADYLFSPGDNNECAMTIVGDPAWLQQGEATFGIDSKNFNFNGFLPDGTINYDSQQILFEVLFNTPTDYNLNTGLMDPNSPSTTSNANSSATSQPGGNRKSFIFLAKEVVSEFVKGKFTQQLKGVKINYFADQAQKVASSARPTNAETTTNISNSESRPSNSSVGPAGDNSIPTNQPAFALNDDNGYAYPPASGDQVITTNNDTVVQSTTNSNNPDPVGTAPVTPLPASIPTPPTSDGDIVTVQDANTNVGQSSPNLAPAPLTIGELTTQQQIQNVARAEAGLPVTLPPPNAYQQEILAAFASVNTKSPQQMNKSDQ